MILSWFGYFELTNLLTFVTSPDFVCLYQIFVVINRNLDDNTLIFVTSIGFADGSGTIKC